MSDELTPEERIRQRAYELWEQAGCPHGQDEQYWHAAEAEFEADILREQNEVLERPRSTK